MKRFAFDVVRVVGLLFALGGGHALAQDPSPDEALAAVREQVLYANYSAAATGAQQLLTRTDLTARQRLAAIELLAIVQIATRNRAAPQTIAEVFRRDPEHRLSDPDASPTVIAAFQRARGQSQPIEVTLENQTPERLETREATTIQVQLGGAVDAIDELRLEYRYDPEGTWSSVVMPIDLATGRAEARVPLAPGTAAYELQFRVEGRAPSGYVLTRLGDQAPLTVAVPEETRRVDVLGGGTGGGGGGGPIRGGDEGGGGVLSQWWFWTIAVVVVAGGAVGGYVLFGPPSEGPPEGSLGSGALR